MVGAATTASTGVASAADGNVTICHQTTSDTNPYVVNAPAKDGNVSGHADHTGPLWNPTLKKAKIQWGDIIPPFTYDENGVTKTFPGLNYDIFGALFIAQGCNIPTPALSLTVVKVNDANADGTFSDTESAAAAGLPVPFRVTVTNTSIVPVTITSLTDAVGATPISFSCLPTVVGTVLDPGDSTSCAVVLPAYSPLAGTSKTNTVTVVAAQAAGPNLPADPNTPTTVQDTSTVSSPEIIVVPTTPPATTPPPTTPPPTTPPPTTAPPTTPPATTPPPTTPPPTTAPPTTPPATTPPPTTAPPTTPPPTTAPPADEPDVAIVKTGPASASPGDTVTWTLTVSNTGTATATGATVTDTLPDGVAFVSATGLGWDCSYTTALSCTDTLPLAAGATSPITVVGTLGTDFTADSFTNTAVVGPDDATPGDNTSSATTTVTIPTQGGGGGGEVTGPGTPSAGGGGGGVGLPFTGAPIGLMMLVGQTLFAFGGMMLLLGRRRRV
jgi:uncharacterized repeat protein (TIGR01451 family)